MSSACLSGPSADSSSWSALSFTKCAAQVASKGWIRGQEWAQLDDRNSLGSTYLSPEIAEYDPLLAVYTWQRQGGVSDRVFNQKLRQSKVRALVLLILHSLPVSPCTSIRHKQQPQGEQHPQLSQTPTVGGVTDVQPVFACRPVR